MSKKSKKKFKKQVEKYRNSKEGRFQKLKSRAASLRRLLAGGLTLEEVAVKMSIAHSELVSEINDSPVMVQALEDGRADGKAFWHTRLKRYMLDRNVNQNLVNSWLGNYMDWWNKPTPNDFNENTRVIINVSVRKPTKKEKRGMEAAKEYNENI